MIQKKTEEINRKIGLLQGEMNELENAKKRIEQQKENDWYTRLEFEVKPEHLRLLKQMNVCWWHCEFGSPAIDPKRPYGNSSVYADIGEILQLKTKYYDRALEDWVDEFVEIADRIHKEMEFVLQILVYNNGVEIGKYKRKETYNGEWVKE